MDKGGDKEALARYHTFETLEYTATRIGLHLDTIFHIEHSTRLGPYTLSRIKFYFYQLHVIPKDGVVNYICCHVVLSV